MIEDVWRKIVDYEGQIFKQIRGKEFSYKVIGNVISLSSTNRHVPKSEIIRALEYVPFINTTVIQHLQAPSYIYAILMDERIRNGEW